MKKPLLLILTAAMAGGGMAAAIAAPDAPADTEIKTVGKPQNCLNIRQIRSTDVVDKNTIDFKMTNGKIYRNILPNSCSSLRFEEAFSYRVSTGQLCNIDIIRVLQNFGGRIEQGEACGLGKFQQIEKARADG
ncbi:hypothetical protein ACFOWX_09450 [Sphingorhabdus arenilitoris]|uniref:Uncharacterized protein n=1 Tax=Sphingorhabdus arenilitoris TaxID=1490041 RepID=A0ABV8RH96_9SPHN